jgi:hypothetical protein
MRTLLGNASNARVDIQRHFLFRMGLIAWKDTKAAVQEQQL